ncbi:MAG TPA: alpha/beta hydrolase [Actinomycetes bacterium]|nr:alpha/beta hydrolase [Actinomycetes bacterium]
MTPCVLLHAFPLNSTMYDDLKRANSELNLLTPDFPGFGRAARLDSPPSLDAYAELVADELSAQGVSRAVIGGTSMGGYVAMAFARLHPDQVAGLILIDTKATADPEEVAIGRRAMAQRMEDELTVEPLVESVSRLLGATTREQRQELVDEVTHWVQAVDPLAAAWAQRAMAARPDSMSTLRQIGVPSLVVVGDEDVLTPPEHSDAMAQVLVDCRHVVVAGSGHLSPVEAPEIVAPALADFVAALDG